MKRFLGFLLAGAVSIGISGIGAAQEPAGTSSREAQKTPKLGAKIVVPRDNRPREFPRAARAETWGKRWEERMALDAAARERRIEALDAERSKIEAQMRKVQSTKALSLRRDRLVEIDEEIKRLNHGKPR